jgi:parallel beta-helix repeat protein
MRFRRLPRLAALTVGAFLAFAGAAQAAATPISSCSYLISAPGDYELVADLDCGNGGGVLIDSSDVHVSLNGHSISHAFVALWWYANDLDNVTVSGPGTILSSSYGVYVNPGTHAVVDGITISSTSNPVTTNTSGPGNSVHGVTASGGSYAFQIYGPADVSGNSCSGNAVGIYVGIGPADVHGNTCNNNTDYGIYVSSDSGNLIHANTALGNGSFDAIDTAPDCGTNQWYGNLFGTFSPPCANNAPGAGAPGDSGPVCTITGTAGNDRLRGTGGDDVICGLGGDDVLDGRGGNDEVYGDEGNDTVIGKGGNDKLLGGAGTDLLLPGSGDDAADGGDGARDRVLFSDITGGGVHVLLASGAVSPEGGSNVGNDTLSNIEQVFGSQQADVLIAQIAGVASTLKGGAGDDQLDVGDGDGLDTVVGNQGADTCNTDAGDKARDC